MEGDVARRAHEQRAGGAVDDLGGGADRSFVQRDEGFRRGQRVDAAHPLAAVVVAGAEEILHHQGPDAGAGGPRGQGDRDGEDGAEDQRGLGDAAPFGAAAAEHLADQGDRQQEDAAGDQGEAVEDDIAGDVDIDRPAAVAHGGQRDQRGGQDDGGGAASTSAKDSRWNRTPSA